MNDNRSPLGDSVAPNAGNNACRCSYLLREEIRRMAVEINGRQSAMECARNAETRKRFAKLRTVAAIPAHNRIEALEASRHLRFERLSPERNPVDACRG